MHFDFTGLAILIASVSSAVVSIGTFIRQGALHKLVNAQQTDLNKAIQLATAGQAHAEGQIQGAAEARANQIEDR